MYKLIFADDEALIRKNIKQIIQWEDFGFELIGCCENGHELLDLVEQEIPDLVITDIDMPFVSGIEVARQLKQMNPQVKIIFLTGYSDFEYAQKAIDFNVLKYILKPITIDQMQNLLREIKKILDEEYVQKNKIHSLNQFYEQNKPIMQSVILNNLLVEEANPNDIKSKINLLNLDRLKSNRFQVAVLLIDEVDSESEWKESKQLMEFAAYNILKEILEERNIGYGIIGNNRVTILLCNNDSLIDYQEDFTKTLEEIRISISQYLKFTVSIGVGRIKGNINQIHESSEEANAAVGYKKVVGINRLIYIQDIEPHRKHHQSIDIEYEKKVLNIVKIGNIEELNTVYQEIINEIEKKKLSIEQMRIWGLTFSFNLFRDVEHIGINVTNILDINLLKKISDTLDFQEIYNIPYEFCVKLLDVISFNRVNSYSSITDEAVGIINKNYTNPELSVDMVSNMVNLSASYFRSIFKKEMGKTFGNYVTEFRMEKAKDLILTTNMKNYEIAEATGYLDPHYFSYCFKKHFNKSPNELRITLK